MWFTPHAFWLATLCLIWEKKCLQYQFTWDLWPIKYVSLIHYGALLNCCNNGNLVWKWKCLVNNNNAIFQIQLYGETRINLSSSNCEGAGRTFESINVLDGKKIFFLQCVSSLRCTEEVHCLSKRVNWVKKIHSLMEYFSNFSLKACSLLIAVCSWTMIE